MTEYKEVVSISDWQELKKESINAFELIVFKYSTRCPLSYDIQDTFEEWFSSLQADERIVAVKVDVIASRELSNRIANETGIRHESPQVIWFTKDNSVKWSGSHFDISNSTLNACLQEL